MAQPDTSGSRLTLFTILVLVLFALSAPHLSAQCASRPGCVLVWADEFDGTEVDLTKWTFQLGDGTEVGLPGGWGNNELQYYQAENATVAGGQRRDRHRGVHRQRAGPDLRHDPLWRLLSR